ncbi:hypothetical protein SDC9_167753 [bioreactor metagenome]|uniref:Uncharacterized protein n=1 Tax=bioreactor metagenome TaxID=1076179 RepID=A0A645G8E4_9ZZZZ
MFIPFSPLMYLTVSGKVVHTLLAKGMAILLARPGVMSDSCAITGTPFSFAPNTTGTATNPPLLNTTSGFIFLISAVASFTPFITLKTSVRFSFERYRLSLPDDTA